MKSLLMLLLLGCLGACASDRGKTPAQNKTPPPTKLRPEARAGGRAVVKSPVKVQPRTIKSSKGPWLVQTGSVKVFGALRWLNEGDVFLLKPPDLTPGYRFLHAYSRLDGARLNVGSKGPLITVNGRVVGLAVPDDPVELAALISKHGDKLRSIVLSVAPKNDAHLKALVTELARLPSKRLLLSTDASTLAPQRLRHLAPLYSRIHALRMVFPGSPRYSMKRSQRDFRAFMTVLAKMPAIRWLQIHPFGLGARELALLRQFVPGKRFGKHRLTILPWAPFPRPTRALLGAPVLRNLREVYLGHAPATDQMLSVVGKLKELRRVELHFTKITDKTLHRLGQLSKLEYMLLMNTRVTGAGLSAFKGHKRLVALNAMGTRMDDAGLQHTAAIPSLRAISVSSCGQVTDRGVAHLARLPNLQVLDLARTKVTGSGLRAFAGNRTLKTLHLAGSPVTDAALAHVAAIPNLEELSLGDTAITDQGLAALARLKNLRRLRLWSAKINGSGLAALTQLPKLERLDLSYTQVTDQNLEALRGMKSLRHLGLQNTRVTNRVIAILRALPTLQWVTLTDTKVEWRLVEALEKELKKRR